MRVLLSILSVASFFLLPTPIAGAAFAGAAALREEVSNSTPAFREECFAGGSTFRGEILTALDRGRACYGTAHGVDEELEGSI